MGFKKIPSVIRVGVAAEQYSRRPGIDISEMLEMLPDATPQLFVVRPGEREAKPATVTLEGTTLYWEVNNYDTRWDGCGTAQVVLTKSGDNTSILESQIIRTAICKTSLSDEKDAPDPYETWTTQLLDAADRIESTASEVAANAEAALEAKDVAESSAEAAKGSEDKAKEYADAAKEAADTSVAQVDLVKAEGEKQIGLVSDEGTRQIGLATDKGAEEIELVAAAGSAQRRMLDTVGANYAEAASGAADAAIAAKLVAETAALNSETAKEKSEEAKAKAEDAQLKAEEAQAKADEAKGKAETAAENAKASADAAAGSAAAAAQTLASVNAAGEAQIEAIQAEGSAQVTAVRTEGASQVGEVKKEGSTQVTAVADKGAEVLASIPQDYTQTLQDISDLKSALAPDYDAATTYAKDTFVYHGGKLYHCLEDITAPEEFTASKWREVYVGEELTDLIGRAITLEWLERSRTLTPAQIQQIVGDGNARKYFEIGDVILIPWTDYTPATPVEYEYPFVVAHFGDAEDEAGNIYHDAMYIQAMYATPQTIAFDAPELIRADEEAFDPDLFYYTRNDDGSYTEQTVTAGDAIPTDVTYYHHYRTGMAARLRYGSDHYGESAYRQWLNSEGGKGEWWTAQHPSDVAPGQAATVPGWLTGFTDEWKAIFNPVKVGCYCNTVCDGGGNYYVYDKFFLPSVEQLYGSPQVKGIEGEYWEYWKEETGLPSPSNGSSSNTNPARRIPAVNAPQGSAVTVRARSAYRSGTATVWSCHSSGYLSGYAAYYASRALPACVIYNPINLGASAPEDDGQ